MAEAADLVQRLLALGHEKLDDSLALLHADAEWIPPDSAPVCGHDAIRRRVAQELDRLGADVPEAVPLNLVECGSRVVVFGQLRSPRPTGDHQFVEVSQIAWLYEVAGGQISRVAVFTSWDQARAAAGIAAGTGPTRRLRSGWSFARVRAQLGLAAALRPAL